MTSALDGIRVLDFSRVLSGPYATMQLADLGADVVKVEHPSRGDDTRGFGPPFAAGVSTYFLSINRGKRSIALDLKDEHDLRTALLLADEADVVVENFRPGVMKRLGLGYEELRARNPGVVYCSISGFGQAAGAKPGYDVVVQGLSGIPSLTGSADTPPFKCATSIADLVAGLNATQGILAALLRRSRTGAGGFIDVPMLDGQLSLLTYHASSWLNAGVAPRKLGNDHPSIHPYSAFRAADGYFNIAVGSEKLWELFCGLLREAGLGDGDALRDDPRFRTNPDRVENRDALNDVLLPIFATHPTDFWLEHLAEAGIPAGPIHSVAEALEQVELAEHPHPEGAGFVRSVPLPYALDDTPRSAERRAPKLGEHTSEVLDEWLDSKNR